MSVNGNFDAGERAGRATPHHALRNMTGHIRPRRLPVPDVVVNLACPFAELIVNEQGREHDIPGACHHASTCA